jgi:hypothetical protein
MKLLFHIEDAYNRVLIMVFIFNWTYVYVTKHVYWMCISWIKMFVVTLALGLQPRQGLAKVRAKRKLGSHISCSRECKRVWGNEPSHSQGNSHFGSWSPGELSNLQRAIARVKTHWIEVFLISLQSSWNVNAWNGLTWPIWTRET